MNTTRRMSDWGKYFKAKDELPKPDGKHCIICGADLPKYKSKYCKYTCWLEWFKKIDIIDWNGIKKQALERDSYTCQDCGFKSENNMYRNGKRLEVHHVIPIKDGGESLDVKNCVTLCSACHIKIHRKLRKIKLVN